HDLAVGLDTPLLARDADAGNLDAHVGRSREKAQRGAPCGDAFRRAVRRQTGVIEDDDRIAEIVGESTSLAKMPPRLVPLRLCHRHQLHGGSPAGSGTAQVLGEGISYGPS